MPPDQDSSGNSRLPRTGVGALDYELAEEMVIALGNAGRRVEKSIEKLSRQERGEAGRREDLLREAADAVYAYFIQRELCGLKRHDDLVRRLSIPRAVLVRLGAH